MSATTTAPDARPADRLGALDETLAAVLREEAAAHAADVDAGRADLRDRLAELGARGLLHLGAPANHAGGLAAMAGVIAALARGCMSSAFSTWAHRAVVEYVATAASPFVAERTLPALRRGTLVGSTAMATAFQDQLGLCELGVTLRHEGDDVVLDGRIGWASNLFDAGFIVVLPARDADGARYVVAVPGVTPGLEVAPYPPLLALNATASSSFALDGVRLDRRWVLTADVEAFLAAVRPTFLLLQAAFCLGLADESLAAAAARLTGAGEALAGELADLTARCANAAERATAQCAAVGGAAPPAAVATTRVRLDAARIAVESVALEGKTRGGAGYVATSATARRLREAAFLPIQSPTEAQLRWELARSA